MSNQPTEPGEGSRDPWGRPPSAGWGQQPGPAGPWPSEQPQRPGQPASGWQGAQRQGWSRQPGPGLPHAYLPPPKPGVVPLRPLGVGDLLDGSFQTVRRNAAATLGLAVLVQLLVGLGTTLFMLPFFATLLAPEVLAGADPDLDRLVGSGLVFGVGALGLGLVSAVFLFVVQGLVTVPALRSVVDRRTRFGEMFALARPSIASLVGLGLLWALGALLVLGLAAGAVVLTLASGSPESYIPYLLLALPALGVLAVWVAVKLALAPHAIVGERLGIVAGIARSWELTRSSWWRCLGILLLVGIIVGVAGSLITSPLGFASGIVGGMAGDADPAAALEAMSTLSIVLNVATAIVAGLGAGYQACVTALLYVDLRIRREGFDVVLLREAESGAPAAIPGLANPR